MPYFRVHLKVYRVYSSLTWTIWEGDVHNDSKEWLNMFRCLGGLFNIWTVTIRLWHSSKCWDVDNVRYVGTVILCPLTAQGINLNYAYLISHGCYNLFSKYTHSTQDVIHNTMNWQQHKLNFNVHFIIK